MKCMRFSIVFLCLFFTVAHSQVHHWETIVKDNSSWYYQVPTAASSPEWITPSFTVNSWFQGTGGFGYGDGDDNTVLPSSAVSVYTRIEFTIANLNQIVVMALHFDYDDGFVAYLNGTEVARNGLSGTNQPTFDQLATISHEAKLYQNQQPDQLIFNQNQLNGLLVNGTNVFCVEVHNQLANSTDFTCRNFFYK